METLKARNAAIDQLTARRPVNQGGTQAQDPSAAKDLAAKSRKGLTQKKIAMKHIVYFLETHPIYRKSPFLHKAYCR